MCTQPVTAWQLQEKYRAVGVLTSQLIFLSPNKFHRYDEMQVPCGKCIACLKLRALARASLLYCELQTTEGETYFLTLTYDDKHLPSGKYLDVKAMPLFIKRYRKHRKEENHPYQFRYEQIGELGELSLRQHAHMCGFNMTIPDLELYSQRDNSPIYTSESITKIWGNGSVKISPLTIENIIYTTQHVVKKIGSNIPPNIRSKINKKTGEYTHGKFTTHATRSSKPGMGAAWFEKYGKSDLYATDFFLMPNGSKVPVPKSFDTKLKVQAPDLYEIIKENRIEKSKPKTTQENERQAKFNIYTQNQKAKKRNQI